MSEKPEPNDYYYTILPPTHILDTTFVIQSMEETTYEGKPQLKLTVIIEGSTEFSTVYVSNGTVMAFLRDLQHTEYFHDPLQFYQQTEAQRHYQIRYAIPPFESPPTNPDIPF